MRTHVTGAVAAAHAGSRARQARDGGVAGRDGARPGGAPAFSQVAVSGDTVVAVGSQFPATPSFRISADLGRTWVLAFTRSQAGPVAGHQATTVAGSPGGWAALGPHAIWVSSDGLTWTLVSARGLAAPGETITGLTKDSWGYLATGTSVRPGTGLVWTSQNGVTWHRFTAAQFGLAKDAGEQVFAMTDAATDWNVTLIAGSIRAQRRQDLRVRLAQPGQGRVLAHRGGTAGPRRRLVVRRAGRRCGPLHRGAAGRDRRRPRRRPRVDLR